MRRYYWRQNDLQVGKSPNFKPTVNDVARLLEEDTHKTWNFANLGNTLLSSQRIKEKIKYSNNVLFQFESTAQRGMPISKLFGNFEKQYNEVFIFAHATPNYRLTNHQ